MSHSAAPTSLEKLQNFRFERVLNEDPLAHSLTILGTFPGRVQAIIRIEKTALNAERTRSLFAASPDQHNLIERVELEASTDIYTWLFGWFRGEGRERDVKINVICPATDVHVRKYTKQDYFIVRETPALYEEIVKPYIAAFPPARTQWLQNILLGISEQEKILFSSPDFVILPDMKWDLRTKSALYLLALVRHGNIRSLRDLRGEHIGLLKDVQSEAHRIVSEKWGLGEGSLRIYVHYQPSYYHFHVHIVNANYIGQIGMLVGQAHLLDNIISLLELDGEIFQKTTLTYGLGDQHGLFDALHAVSQTKTLTDNPK